MFGPRRWEPGHEHSLAAERGGHLSRPWTRLALHMDAVGGTTGLSRSDERAFRRREDLLQ